MSLDGRVALVTGGSRGIGRAVALALAEDGADIAVHYHKDKDAAEQTAEGIRALGRRALPVSAAVEDSESLGRMAATVEEELGPVSILINNAGVASRGRSVAKTDAEELERLMRIHALGPHELCKRILPGMRQQPRGDIVMVSSMATKYNAAGGGPYNMGKAAMEALAFTLAAEERRNGIRVNVVAPGLVETEMGRRLIKATAGVDDMRQIEDQMPFGRVCQPEDIANTIRHLVSDRSAYTTGQRIGIDGGGQ
jgi:NAD(P)-dependent dehydrogenase (short-subunit alcohol dehydrogenase family)